MPFLERVWSDRLTGCCVRLVLRTDADGSVALPHRQCQVDVAVRPVSAIAAVMLGASAEAVRADLTVTFHRHEIGHVLSWGPCQLQVRPWSLILVCRMHLAAENVMRVTGARHAVCARAPGTRHISIPTGMPSSSPVALAKAVPRVLRPAVRCVLGQGLSPLVARLPP